MVFLVKTGHNESSVPPTGFLLSTPAVVILKSVEFLSVCALSRLRLISSNSFTPFKPSESRSALQFLLLFPLLLSCPSPSLLLFTVCVSGVKHFSSFYVSILIDKQQYFTKKESGNEK